LNAGGGGRIQYACITALPPFRCSWPVSSPCTPLSCLLLFLLIRDSRWSAPASRPAERGASWATCVRTSPSFTASTPVWTGTSRTPNLYRGRLRERTFETAFLEYGAMQNLVRATGRTVWYLNDPVEDNPDHDWEDYRVNWESTMVASLFQPEVWRYEVAPWPERVFGGRYPKRGKPQERELMPPT